MQTSKWWQCRYIYVYIQRRTDGVEYLDKQTVRAWKGDLKSNRPNVASYTLDQLSKQVFSDTVWATWQLSAHDGLSKLNSHFNLLLAGSGHTSWTGCKLYINAEVLIQRRVTPKNARLRAFYPTWIPSHKLPTCSFYILKQ
jgi:hypothetical protein